MAEDELGDWDQEDFAPPPVKLTDEYGAEIVKLDEDEEKKAAQAAAAAAAQQQKEKAKKQQKGKDKQQKESSAEATEQTKLTPQELENLQRASDLAAAAETFGISTNSSTDVNTDHFEPKSKEDFDTFIKLLSLKIGTYSKSEHYHDFLSNLFTELCVKLDSEHIRRYGKELTALGNEKLKEEKEKEKQKQPKKKKPTLAARKADDLDDVVGDDDRVYNDYGGDDEDFM